MAIEKNIESTGMKIVSNHGEVDGKIKKSSKTYGDVKHDVTDDAFVATAKAIGKLQQPVRESQIKVTAESMTEGA